MLKVQKIVLATRNRGKAEEMRALLRPFDIELIAASDLPDVPDVEEHESTLEGNARLKAVFLHEHTGLPALADDTGLEVNALGGAPGVHSARYAGPEANDANNRKRLLEVLTGEKDRSARFRTVIAFARDGEVQFFEGICQGTIIDRERGTGGFGYDPIFVPEGEQRTFAELTPEEKNAISHRGRALRSFLSYLEKQTK